MNIIQLTKLLGNITLPHQRTLSSLEDSSISEIIRGLTQQGQHYSGWVYNRSSDMFKVAANEVAENLKSHGFEIVGAGHFSLAVSHLDTPKVVYKISFRADDAYSHYALWCRANPHEHAPTMLRIERHGDWHFYAMPRYEKPKNSWDLYQSIRKWAEYSEQDADALDRATVPRSLRMFLIKMRDYFNNVCPLDLHDENFMMCPDTGRIIITDPVSFNTRRNPEHELKLRNQLQAEHCDEVEIRPIDYEELREQAMASGQAIIVQAQEPSPFVIGHQHSVEAGLMRIVKQRPVRTKPTLGRPPQFVIDHIDPASFQIQAPQA